MLLSRVSVLAVLMLSVSGGMALAMPSQLLPQSVAQNQETPDGQEPGSGRLMQQLNLTPQQTQQIQNIRNKYKNRMTEQRQTLRQQSQELRQLMAGTASAAQIRAKYNQVKALQQQMTDSRFESMLEMREVMNPDQRAKFAELMQNRRGNFRNRMGKG